MGFSAKAEERALLEKKDWNRSFGPISINLQSLPGTFSELALEQGV